MDDAKLVSMATQIAAFFRPYPEPEAVAGIANHIRAFWTPGMRDALFARIAADRAGIEPLVVQAFSDRETAKSPIVPETADPDRLGQMASDAG